MTVCITSVEIEKQIADILSSLPPNSLLRRHRGRADDLRSGQTAGRA